jgi:hypothetical protein
MDIESFNPIWLIIFVSISVLVVTHLQERSKIKKSLWENSPAELAKARNNKAKVYTAWALKQEADKARAKAVKQKRDKARADKEWALKQEADKVRADKARADKVHEDAARQLKVKADKEYQVAALRKERLALKFSTLKSNLPFYTSNRPPSAELAEHDKKMWEEVTKLVNGHDAAQATLYFVKIKSLLDDNEYYKIGVTTVGVKARFQKSTQVELIETVCSFDTELWKAAFLEYHFLREFRLYDGLASSLGELRPEVGFSGYTEVVRSNSVNKISQFFSELDVYNELS